MHLLRLMSLALVGLLVGCGKPPTSRQVDGAPPPGPASRPTSAPVFFVKTIKDLSAQRPVGGFARKQEIETYLNLYKRFLQAKRSNQKIRLALNQEIEGQIIRLPYALGTGVELGSGGVDGVFTQLVAYAQFRLRAMQAVLTRDAGALAKYVREDKTDFLKLSDTELGIIEAALRASPLPFSVIAKTTEWGKLEARIKTKIADPVVRDLNHRVMKANLSYEFGPFHPSFRARLAMYRMALEYTGSEIESLFPLDLFNDLARGSTNDPFTQLILGEIAALP
jgi:hypothetical protein